MYRMFLIQGRAHKETVNITFLASCSSENLKLESLFNHETCFGDSILLSPLRGFDLLWYYLLRCF
jgi:hypothetical protein